jgi:hypothetical protein
MAMTKRRPTRIVQPRRVASEVPWRPPFAYVCAANERHLLQADAAVCGPCPVCVEGDPCGGELVRFGIGSRGPRS